MTRRTKQLFAYYFIGVAVLAVLYALMPFVPELTWHIDRADAAVNRYAFSKARSRYVAARFMEQWKSVPQVPIVDAVAVGRPSNEPVHAIVDPAVESLLATIDVNTRAHEIATKSVADPGVVKTVQTVAKVAGTTSKKAVSGIKVALAAETPSEQTTTRTSQSPSKTISKKPRGNSIVIASIKVDMQVLTGDEKTLDRGAWLMPGSATPGKGNTVISAHRYQSFGSKSFYHLDKIHEGDIISVWWNGVEFRYKVTRNFVVSPDQVDVLNKSAQVKLTLITCDPVFSTKNRRIVVAELITD